MGMRVGEPKHAATGMNGSEMRALAVCSTLGYPTRRCAMARRYYAGRPRRRYADRGWSPRRPRFRAWGSLLTCCLVLTVARAAWGSAVASALLLTGYWLLVRECECRVETLRRTACRWRVRGFVHGLPVPPRDEARAAGIRRGGAVLAAAHLAAAGGRPVWRPQATRARQWPRRQDWSS